MSYTEGHKTRDPRIKDSHTDRPAANFNKRDPRIRDIQSSVSQQHTSSPLAPPLVPPPIPSFPEHPSLVISPFNPSLQSSTHSSVHRSFPPPKNTPSINPCSNTLHNPLQFSKSVPSPSLRLPFNQSKRMAPNISTQFQHTSNTPPVNPSSSTQHNPVQFSESVPSPSLRLPFNQSKRMTPNISTRFQQTSNTPTINPSSSTQHNPLQFFKSVPSPSLQPPINPNKTLVPNISCQFKHTIIPPIMRQHSLLLTMSSKDPPSVNYFATTPSERIPPPPPPPIFTVPPPDSTPFLPQTFQPAGTSEGQWIPQVPIIQCQSTQQSGSVIFEINSSQEWVDNWIKRKVTITKGKQDSQEEPTAKICELKDRLKTAFRLVRELDNAARTLNVMAKTVTAKEWDTKCEEIEMMKEELTNAIRNLQMTPEEIMALKLKYDQRIKKRKRLKRLKERRKTELKDATVKRKNLHIHIDNWQKEMQEEVERVYREDRLAREADAVLFEVTHKKVEARRQLALLSALRELHKVRNQRLVTVASQVQLDTFNAVIDRLQCMWERSVAECALEEQALRGMLNDAIIKSDPVKRFKKLVLNEWEAAIFGVLGSTDSGNQRSLLKTRREWDSFVVKPPAVLASTIPPYCILPVPPSDDQWSTLLKYQS